MWDAAQHRQNPRTHRRIFSSAYRWGSVHRISPSSDIMDLQGCLSNREHGLETLWANPQFTPAEGGSGLSPLDSSGCKHCRTGIFWTWKTWHESVCVHVKTIFSFHKILCLKLRYVQRVCICKEYLFHVLCSLLWVPTPGTAWRLPKPGEKDVVAQPGLLPPQDHAGQE